MRTPARYRASVKFLKNAGDDWRKLIELVGPCLHDPKAAHEPYEALVHAIAYQQLTAKAGDATIKTISEGAQSGLVPTRDVAVKMDDRALIERISSIKGIGRWTVEMLLMYSLERMDVLPVDDFGIRKGYRILKSLSDAPKPRELRELGKALAPHRTVASWYLWRVPRERGKSLKT
jgi:DNA-3-methyladenine glycosylase II